MFYCSMHRYYVHYRLGISLDECETKLVKEFFLVAVVAMQ